MKIPIFKNIKCGFLHVLNFLCIIFACSTPLENNKANIFIYKIQKSCHGQNIFIVLKDCPENIFTLTQGLTLLNNIAFPCFVFDTAFLTLLRGHLLDKSLSVSQLY